MIELGHITDPEQLTSFLMQLCVHRAILRAPGCSHAVIIAISGLHSDRTNSSSSLTATTYELEGSYEIDTP